MFTSLIDRISTKIQESLPKLREWKQGKKLSDGYTIQKTLGKGGFGITYLAIKEDNTQVVIKTLNPRSYDIQNHDYFKHDFDNEPIRLAKVCNHAHIVNILEVIDVKGIRCIVMEYVEGINLSSLVNNDLSFLEYVMYILHIGDALKHIHQQGWIHRDAHPDNIIIKDTKQGKKAILIDFGLCREINDQKN